jgi:hypothetical protein
MVTEAGASAAVPPAVVKVRRRGFRRSAATPPESRAAASTVTGAATVAVAPRSPAALFDSDAASCKLSLALMWFARSIPVCVLVAVSTVSALTMSGPS